MTDTIDPNSLTDFLKSHDLPSDYTARAALAHRNDILNYIGTAEQNSRLLAALRQQSDNPTVWQSLKAEWRKLLGEKP
jgi:hypothetical protein